MALAFKAINWTPNEQVGEYKMDTLAQNTEWLFRNTPRAHYTLPGLSRNEGIKIASGRAVISKNNSTDTARVTVRFGNFFSVGCEPNITTGVAAVGQNRIFCVIRGIGRLIPDHNGFEGVVNVAALAKKNDKIANTMYLTFQAMGY